MHTINTVQSALHPKASYALVAILAGLLCSIGAVIALVAPHPQFALSLAALYLSGGSSILVVALIEYLNGVRGGRLIVGFILRRRISP